MMEVEKLIPLSVRRDVRWIGSTKSSRQRVSNIETPVSIMIGRSLGVWLAYTLF